MTRQQAAIRELKLWLANGGLLLDDNHPLEGTVPAVELAADEEFEDAEAAFNASWNRLNDMLRETGGKDSPYIAEVVELADCANMMVVVACQSLAGLFLRHLARQVAGQLNIDLSVEEDVKRGGE
jgi:hypothetical protein